MSAARSTRATGASCWRNCARAVGPYDDPSVTSPPHAIVTAPAGGAAGADRAYRSQRRDGTPPTAHPTGPANRATPGITIG